MIGLTYCFISLQYFRLENYLVTVFVTISGIGLVTGWLLIKSIAKGLVVYRINAFLYLSLLLYLLVFGGEGGSKILWLYTFPLVCFILFYSLLFSCYSCPHICIP